MSEKETTQKRAHEKYIAKKQQWENDNKAKLCLIHFISTIVTVGLAAGTLWVL